MSLFCDNTHFDMSWQAIRPRFRARSTYFLPKRRKILPICIRILALWLLYWAVRSSTRRYGQYLGHQDERIPTEVYLNRGAFYHHNLPGFINPGVPENHSCELLKHHGDIGIQQSLEINDDIRSIARALDSHEMIIFPTYEPLEVRPPSDSIIDKYWHELSGSSIWLPQQKVFLMVSRIMFGTGIAWPRISFLRGRLFDADWNHLANHTLKWNGQMFTFPLTFDIQTPYELEGSFYGPEDPRLILEDDVEGAEPCLIFSMVSPVTDWWRAMYIHRPFSGTTTLLTMPGRPLQDVEKNWAPFFVPPDDRGGSRQLNEFIHFLYWYDPLSILRCHLHSGECKFIFVQDQDPDASFDDFDFSPLRGGTNLLPVPLTLPRSLAHRFGIYLSFSRTMTESRCGRIYRPELVVMTRIDSNFSLSYVSEPFDFSLGPNNDHHRGEGAQNCERNRVVIPMSIGLWDLPQIDLKHHPPGRKLGFGGGQKHRVTSKETTARISQPSQLEQTDVMTVTFSVDDSSVRVVRLTGILELVKNIPQVKVLENLGKNLKSDADLTSMIDDWAANDIRMCLLEAAESFADAWVSQVPESEWLKDQE